MTIIKPTAMQDILQRELLQEASQKAKLNLSEVLALNEKFGTKLEYVPLNDVVEFSTYNDLGSKKSKEFAEFCAETAFELAQKPKSLLVEQRINGKKKNTFNTNIKTALEKLKTVLK